MPQGRYSFLTFILVDRGGGDVITCSGSLIAPLYVLTAAHCVTDANGVPLPAEQFALVIGRASRLTPPGANIRHVAAVSPRNAAAAQENAAQPKAVALERLRTQAPPAIDYVRGLSDEQLQRAGTLPFGGDAMTAEAVITHILIGHPREHLASIQAVTT